MINRKFKANRPKAKKYTDIKPYWRVIEKIVAESDILLEVIDARMPELSRNPEIEKLVKQADKKLIIILNKADLVSEKDLRKKLRETSKDFPAFIISSTKKTGTKRLREYLLVLGKDKELFRIGILGYPNTGKSSIINALARRKKAKVTSKAGTTHGEQWINAGQNLSIVDSPGVIPLQKEDEVRYALIGSRNVERLKDLDRVAHAVIKLFKNKHPIADFYKIKNLPEEPEEIIEEIGKSKGFLKKGGEVDEKRTEIQIIRDWQQGKLKL